MKLVSLCSLVLLAGSPVLLAAPVKIFITSSSTTDQPAKPGQASSEAAAAARQMEVFTAEALSDQFPCSSSLTPSDVSAMLDWEKQKALLNNPSPNVLNQIASGLGAKILINYTVIQTGNNVTVSASATNTANGSTIFRNAMTIPRNQDLVDAMESFAKSFASSMGSGGPKCSGNWTGTVSVTEEKRGKGTFGDGGPQVKGDRTLHVDCQVQGSVANCQVSYKGSMSGKNGGFNDKASGQAETSVSVGLINGRVSIKLSMLRVKGTTTADMGQMGTISGDSMMTFGGWEGGGGGASGNTYSGSWSDGQGTSMSWNLSMQ